MIMLVIQASVYYKRQYNVPREIVVARLNLQGGTATVACPR